MTHPEPNALPSDSLSLDDCVLLCQVGVADDLGHFYARTQVRFTEFSEAIEACAPVFEPDPAPPRGLRRIPYADEVRPLRGWFR